MKLLGTMILALLLACGVPAAGQAATAEQDALLEAFEAWRADDLVLPVRDGGPERPFRERLERRGGDERGAPGERLRERIERLPPERQEQARERLDQFEERRRALRQELMDLPPDERAARMEELRSEFRQHREGRQQEFRETFEQRWDNASEADRQRFCSQARTRCSEGGDVAGRACAFVDRACTD